MEEKTATFGNSVRCYNPERTLCDSMRSRNRCDEEKVLNAINIICAVTLEASNDIKKMWRKYQNKFAYARDISFNDVIEILYKLIDQK